MSLLSVEISGNLLSESLLESLGLENTRHKFAKPNTYRWDKYDVIDSKNIHLSRIAESYENLKAKCDLLSPDFEKMDISAIREKWIKYFFSQFGYNLQFQNADITADSGNKFCISHRGWDDINAPVIHTVLFSQDLDQKPDDGRHKYSPHDTLQRYLNQSKTDKWGIVTNGKEIRILRDFHHESRKAYIRFDLESIFEGRNFNDFRLLWRLIHPSRFTKNEDNKCILEILFEESKNAGIAIGEDLRHNIHFAIESLANGFLIATPELINKLVDNSENSSIFYQQILRVIYRILFLLYVEQRRLMPGHSSLYAKEYSISSLREKIETKEYFDEESVDLWEGLKVTFEMVYKGAKELGIPPFNGQLFDPKTINILEESQCKNSKLLEAIKYMSIFEQEGILQRISYIELGVDEIGAVYESLLEFVPRVSSREEIFTDEDFGEGRDKKRQIPPKTFFLDPRGTNRKTSGSYYTNPGLVNTLIESALIPVLKNKLRQTGQDKGLQEKALLSLKVCDPACGSAAFLIATTEYLGLELAKIRTQDDYPSDEQIRHSRRDVLRNCIYGVDINPLSVELAKVSLWLTAATSNQPLNFLDHKIKCGNSLIGTTKELIEKGIPSEAYSPVEGDSKEIAKNRQNITKQYYRMKERDKNQLVMEPIVVYNTQISYQNDIKEINENTPEETIKIEQLYRDNRENLTFLRNKFIADYWTSTFFWEHADEKEEYPKQEVLEYLLKSDKYEIKKDIKDKVNKLAEEYKFFHWDLEFPEVFSSGGFDCVLGNPPFLGGLKISEDLGEIYRKWLDINYYEAKGRTDLCAYFFRKSYNILRENGMLGMVATNTIGQGETQEGGLAVIINRGGTITYVKRFVKWPGSANVEVNLIALIKGNWDKPIILDNNIVKRISSRLDRESEQMPKVLKQNKKKAFQGSILLGMGFILDQEETNKLLNMDLRNKDCLFPFINGDDINSRYDHSPSRWVIQFDERTEDEAKKYSYLWDILYQRVYPERMKDKEKKETKYPRMVKEWWKHWNNRKELYKSIKKYEKVLARALTSEIHMLVFVPSNYIYSHAVGIFAFDDYFNFGVLQSNIHESWLRKYASTLRTDVRYTPRDCFETFPFPQDIPQEKKSIVIEIAEKYYLHRDAILKARKIGLTQAYNLFHDSKCKDEDIIIFRSLHANMDMKILACYRWEDIELGHNFIQNDRGNTRYSISINARKEILKRLLDMNLSFQKEQEK